MVEIQHMYLQASYLSTMRVVAEVPSMEMEAIILRRLDGTSSSSEKRVDFHERAQSIVSSLFLDNTNNILSYSTYTIQNYEQIRFAFFLPH